MSPTNQDPELLFPEGDIVGFRAFVYDTDAEGGCLKALVTDYYWEPGILEADATPDFLNSNGFYAHKTLPEAIYQSGRVDGLIFALTGHSGDIIEGETGLRSQYAEIMAIIEPVRPKQIELFPREHLMRAYPTVPIIHQTEISSKIAELGMVTLPRSRPSAMMQWIGPEGELIWAPEMLGPVRQVPNPDEFEMLEAAATYPAETHIADGRLRKASFEATSGEIYVFWEILGDEYSSGPMGFSEAFNTVALAREHMYRHRSQSTDELDKEDL
jgi:hypothetical protein